MNQETYKQRINKILIMSAAIALASCSSQTVDKLSNIPKDIISKVKLPSALTPRPQPSNRSNLDTPLARVKEAGDLKEIYLIGWETTPSINPKSQPPAFSEIESIAGFCRPSTVIDASSTDGKYFIDNETFSLVMKYGQEIAEERFKWRFHNDMANAQKVKMDGIYRRIDPIRNGVTPSSPNGSTPKKIMPSKSQAEEYAKVDEAKDALNSNFGVLYKQDSVIAQEEREYTAKIIALYEDAVNELQRTSTLKSIQLINKFDLIRQNNIMICLQRANQSQTEKDSIQSLEKDAVAIMKQILVSNKSSITQAMTNAGRLTADKRKVYESFFSTFLLRSLAKSELGISAPGGDKKEAGSKLTL